MTADQLTAIQTDESADQIRWLLTSSPLTQLDSKQKRLMLGAVPPEPPPISAKRELFMAEHNTDFPAVKDWRNFNGESYVTPVKAQGLCQSCVAFAVAAAVESAVRIAQKQPKLDIDLSEAHLFYCHDDGNACQNGWWPTGALDFAKNRGIAPENYFPYSAGTQACLVSTGWESQMTRIKGWRNLKAMPEIKNWIDDNGPVVACMEVFSDLHSYKSGVYHHVSGMLLSWHSVLVVGYDDLQGFWICKNCWGEEFGDKGFFNIAYGECSIEVYGMFGIEGVIESRWVKSKKVLSLWANNKEMNAWANIEGEGWQKISAANRLIFFQILTQLIQAKNKNTAVNLRIFDNVIREIYS